jgi:hypothetical protein
VRDVRTGGCEGRLKDGGGCEEVRCSLSSVNQRLGRLTTSSPLPPNTLSVVAARLPPFLCKSHAMSLRSSWGNMCAIWSICAGLILTVRAGLAVDRAPVPAGFDRYHRIARTETIMKTMSCGTFSVCSAMLYRAATSTAGRAGGRK